MNLYHYSDVSGFFNILVGKRLWLSSPHNLNDSQEIHWADKKIRAALQRSRSMYPAHHVNAIEDLYTANRAVPFICSLTEERDLLSQWRAYAKVTYKGCGRRTGTG